MSVALFLLPILAAVLGLDVRRAQAYIEVPYTLGRVVNDATVITVLRVEKVDKVKNTIVYSKVEDLKGKSPDIINHNIAQAGFNPREWQNVIAWAETGKTAVFFSNGSASETCIDTYWYQCYPGGEWWNMYHAEPYLLRTYAGRSERLAPLVRSILSGAEVITTCMIDGDKMGLQLRQCRTQRLKASLKIQDYNAARDFVGWGGDEIKTLSDMPAYSHLTVLPRISGAGSFRIVTADIDNDKKPDVLLTSDEHITLLQNAGGGSFNEVSLPPGISDGGARDAAWGDYDHSGNVSLLLATPGGPRLLTNLGGTKFRDDSAKIPAQPYWHATACAFFPMDGRHALLIADAYSGLHLFRNKLSAPATADVAETVDFEDVTAAGNLAPQGLAGESRVISLHVANITSPTSPSLMVVTESGARLFTLAGGKFTENAVFKLPLSEPASAALAATEDGKHHYLAVVSRRGALQLFLIDTTGRVTDKSSFLPRNLDGITSAAFALRKLSARDGGNQVLELYLGRLNAPNVYLRSDGFGHILDDSAALGLQRRIFNTRALLALPNASVPYPELFFLNQNQESALLLARQQ